MTLTVEFWALFAVLCYNGWNLNEIRKIVRACYVELNTARWENGRSVRSKDHGEGLAALRGQAEDSLE
jgi:hypothetical protein